MSNSLTTYEAEPVWRSFNETLPEAVRLLATPFPAETSFRWRDSLIHVDRFLNDEAPARVVLHHGVGTNARMMSTIVGQHLATQGFDVSAVDMPFFGATNRGSLPVLYDDWVSIGAHYIESILPKDDKPTLLFGFSAGGMLSYHIACVTQRVSGICGTCFLDMQDIEVRRDIAPMPGLNAAIEAVSRGVARILPELRLPLHAVSNMRALTNDARVTALLLRDHGGAGVKLPLSFLESFIEYDAAIEPEEFNLCPIHLLHPGEDRWTPLTASMRFLDRLKAPTVVGIIRGAGHLPITSKALQQLRQAVTSFIRDRAADHSSRLHVRAA